MPEHLSTQMIERYGRRELSALELLVADDHLATCDECYQSVSLPGPWPSTGSVLMESLLVEARTNRDHMSYEQLVAMVDDERTMLVARYAGFTSKYAHNVPQSWLDCRL